MVYNLNESLGYSRGAATRKTAPQTTNQPHNYPVKETILQTNSTTIIIILIN